ncbi:MAG: glucan ABC transporter ATP-binding protein/ permease [Geminicoccaceae bacterium]
MQDETAAAGPIGGAETAASSPASTALRAGRRQLVEFVEVYARALSFLAPERRLAITLGIASLGLATLVFVEPTLFGKVIDVLASSAGRPPSEIWAESLYWLMLWGLFGIGGIVATILVSLHADRLAHRRRLAVMASFFTHVLALPPAFHGATHSGRLMKVMLQGSEQLFGLWLMLFRENLTTFLALLILLPLAIWRNWQLGVLLAVLTLVFAGLSSWVLRQTQIAQQSVERLHSDLAARAGDVFGNVVLVQSFRRLAAEASSIDEMIRRLMVAQYPVLNYWALVSVLSRAASTLTVMAIFALGTWLFVLGRTTVGEIVSYMGFAQLLVGRLEGAMGFANRLFFQKEGLREFFTILDTRSTVAERPGALTMGRAAGNVRFEHVSLSYDGERPAVSDLEIDVPAGTTVALVGPTGAGKSTAMALLLRLRDPDTGRITIDGTDIRDVTLDSLRANVGVVFQESLLFNRSIEDNLLVGRPDATHAEVEAAAKLAQAHDFIIARPDGYRTLVGERGAGLSGGERQRLAIARALLKDPPLLILDEATSALDAATESRVQEALGNLMRGRTSFLIAHRLSTIRDADLILVFDRGRVVERGSFTDLVAQGGRFAELARLQLGTDTSPG